VWLVRAALKNPHAVAVFGLLILLIGGTAITRSPVDLLPQFKTPAVQVLTMYPGMPAEVVERDMTTRIQRWTGQANGIVRQEARSMVGVSIVRDFFGSHIDANTALSMVTSLAMSDLYYLPPGTIPPMVMPFDPTASKALALITVSSPIRSETALYDVAYYQLRNRLQSITGVIAPAVYGGKLRRILAYVDPHKLIARQLSPLDVMRAIQRSNVLIPTGNARLGKTDYQVDAQGMVNRVKDLNKIPIKLTPDGKLLLLKDVATPKDAHQIQTNIVRIDGRRQVYIPIYRQPGANTIAIVDGIRASLAKIQSRLPSDIRLNVVMDQSVFVRKSIEGLTWQALIGGLLVALIVLLFLRNLRATWVIVTALPLAIIAAMGGLYFADQSINTMTLGGIALAIGILIDQSIVVLENIMRHLREGKSALEAARLGAGEVARPVFIGTLTIIAVFLPVVFLTGLGKFLFTPLSLSVAFAVFSSYLIALTLIPTLCVLLFRNQNLAQSSPQKQPEEGEEEDEAQELRAPWYSRVYGGLLRLVLRFRWLVLLAAIGGLVGSAFVIPQLGTALFPSIDSGQFQILVRGRSGLRIEEMEKRIALVEAEVARSIPKHDRRLMIANIGVLLDWPAAYTPNAGGQDAFLNIQLSEDRAHPTTTYVTRLRSRLTRRFPDLEFAFDTGGLLTAALNFGLPAPINVQVVGHDLKKGAKLAEKLKKQIASIPGTVDVYIKQRNDYPLLKINVDRIKAAYYGLTQDEIVKNIVTALNSSINFSPSFWIDHRNGNHYFIGVQYREKDIRSLETLKNIPIRSKRNKKSVLLRNVARFHIETAPAEVKHVNITRVIDIYANVSGRDVGSVSQDVAALVSQVKPPKGLELRVEGEIASIKRSFGDLGFGLLLALLLGYLVLVIQFRSFLDPLIVLCSVPLGGIGVVWTLLLTGTAFSVPALMGVIMMVGIAVSYAILFVDFANTAVAQGQTPQAAVLEAGRIRLRPILMTSLTSMIGLLPLALAEGQANMPMARTLIGGILVSTLLTLLVLPVLYVTFKRNKPVHEQ